MTSLPSINLDIGERLKGDKDFRQRFFLAESSAMIARQLIALRKRRNKSQAEVAAELHTGQPAISRVESADYRNWSFNTLRRLAEAMDARLRVFIEPYEDVIHEYERSESSGAPQMTGSATKAFCELSRDPYEAQGISKEPAAVARVLGRVPSVMHLKDYLPRETEGGRART